MAWRISEPVSFMEYVFLVCLVVIPILYRLLTWINGKETGNDVCILSDNDDIINKWTHSLPNSPQ